MISKGIIAVPRETDFSTEQQDGESEPAQSIDGQTTTLTDTSDASESETEQGPDDPDTEQDSEVVAALKKKRKINWSRAFAYVALPALALLLAVAAGYLTWHNTLDRSSGTARIESVAAAKDTTIALLSYKPDTVEKDLDAARDRLTGTFKDSYTQLIRDVVVPGAKEKHISASATVPAAASVTATPNHAVVLLYVDQNTVIGGDTPSDSVSTVRVTLEKVHGRWLVSEFDPI